MTIYRSDDGKSHRLTLLVHGLKVFGAYYVDTKKRIIRMLMLQDMYDPTSPFIRTKRGKVRHRTLKLPRGSIKMVRE